MQVNGNLDVEGLTAVGPPTGGNNAGILTLRSERSWIFRQYGTGATTALKLTGNSTVNNNKNFLIDTDGNIGISTDNPGYKLHVNGDAEKPGGGSWSNASDRRLKTGVKNFELGLEVLRKIQPVQYHYNGKLQLPEEKEYIGVIAQELKEIMPMMVSEFKGEDGINYLNVDPSAFDFILINAVNQLREMNQELRSEIEDLKAKVDQTIP